MKNSVIYIISIIFLSITAFGCSSECYVSKDSNLSISFLDSITFKTKNISELTVQGVSNDSILYNNKTVNEISLPLHYNDNVTEYKLILPSRTKDSTIVDSINTYDTIILHIEHTPQPQLISKECGCTMFHIINNATISNNTYNFKLDITNSNVTNDDKETHIKILH